MPAGYYCAVGYGVGASTQPVIHMYGSMACCSAVVLRSHRPWHSSLLGVSPRFRIASCALRPSSSEVSSWVCAEVLICSEIWSCVGAAGVGYSTTAAATASANTKLAAVTWTNAILITVVAATLPWVSHWQNDVEYSPACPGPYWFLAMRSSQILRPAVSAQPEAVPAA